MSKWKAIAVMGALLICANLASATVVVYDAEAYLDTYSQGYGNAVLSDTAVKATVDYTGGGNFEITSITDFSGSVLGYPYTMGENPALASTGVISGGVATGVVDWKGSVAGVYTLTNSNGSYSCNTITGGGFKAGDVYALQAYSSGTISPPLNGKTNWDLRPDLPTRIVFGVPEPTTMLLLVGGSLALLRRRHA
jgi:hypothetical protein